MSYLQPYLLLIGRILIAVIFLVSGVFKFVHWGPTAEQIGDAGLPIPHFFLAGATLLELFGGISVLFGWKTRWGAFALILFLVPVTLIMHAFWTMEGQTAQEEMGTFIKNFALVGGLLYVLVFGAGSLSCDQWIARKRQKAAVNK